MKKRVLTVRLLTLLMAMGCLAVTGCTDNDYDVNEIDTTIGIGGDGLELPASSTSDIPLKDVLELEENGVVVEDVETHNYVFRQAGYGFPAANPYIRSITISKSQAATGKVYLSLASAARGTRAAGELHGEGDIYTFKYAGSKPSEVLSLSSAEVSSSMTLHINLSQIHSQVEQIDKMTLTFPAYMKLAILAPTTPAAGNVKVDGNVVTLQDVSTANDVVLGFSITGIDFSKSGEGDMGKAGIVSTSTGDEIQFDGKVRLALSTSHYNITGSFRSIELDNSLDMGNITIESATGKFNPSIVLNNLGNVQIQGVPDFLKDGNVVADIYNPVIKLDIQSNLGIEGKISGRLIAVKDGAEIARVSVPEFTVNPASVNDGKSMVYICRHADGLSIPVSAEMVEVSNLSDLIKMIPDLIRFECDAHANKEKEGTFRLGYRDYSIKPSYSIDAPLAFGADAVIEYNDVFDGWNSDVKDYQLAKDAKIVLTANVANGVPAYLDLEASAIDVNGNDIPASELEVKVEGEIVASADGVTPATSPLTVTITQKDDQALKKLNGLRFSVKGKAKGEDGSVVEGITLNAKNHTLKLTDIKVKLMGKFVYDAN